MIDDPIGLECLWALASNPICRSLPVVARWWSRPHLAHNGCGSAAFFPRRQRQSPGSPAVLSPSSFRSGLIRVAQNARPNDLGRQYLPLPKSTDDYLKTFSLFLRSGTTQSRWLDGSTSSERRGSTGTASLEMPPPRHYLRQTLPSGTKAYPPHRQRWCSRCSDFLNTVCVRACARARNTRERT